MLLSLMMVAQKLNVGPVLEISHPVLLLVVPRNEMVESMEVLKILVVLLAVQGEVVIPCSE